MLIRVLEYQPKWSYCAVGISNEPYASSLVDILPGLYKAKETERGNLELTQEDRSPIWIEKNELAFEIL